VHTIALDGQIDGEPAPDMTTPETSY
jgi:hypothetical protein